MKVFIGEGDCCNLTYQHKVIYNSLVGQFELTDKINEADTIIIDKTCCCTAYHLMDTLDYIKKIKENKNDDAKIYLTGCITRKFKDDPFLGTVEKWLSDNIDYIVPQNQPNLLLRLISQNKYADRDINAFGMVGVYSRDLAEIYIANGCLNNCSFCKNTFQKYPLKSVDLNKIKEAIDMMNENHISQINLKATNICQYGLDIHNEYMLPEIISYLNKKDNIKSVSLVGFSFKEAIRNNFDEVIRDSNKITQLCGSLESGSDRLLSMIRKGFTSEEIINFVGKIREVNFKDLHLNVIAGFPTETMKDVCATLDVLKQLNPHCVDLCRYTNSPFVDSNQYAQLSPSEIQEHTRIYSKVLRKRSVSVEVVGDGYKYN